LRSANPKEPTMADVARLANVGTMTVSRVLNNSAHVNPETAKRVYWAMEVLQYRPNEAARTLRGLKSRSIGVLVPSLADPFFAICAHSINLVAQANGYSMILTTSHGDPEVEYAQAQWMLHRHVEGLILVPTQTQNSRLQERHFERIPIVAFDTPIDIKRIDCVLVENQEGAYRATQHLIEHGHTRIQFLGNDEKLYTIQARMEGYRRAIAAAALPMLAKLDCSSQETVTQELRAARDQGRLPTAFFCANNWITKFLMRSLYPLGIRVPDQAAIVGFDEVEMADLLQPTLTVVRQPIGDVGTLSANLLFHNLKLSQQERPEEGTRKVLPVDLILRASCGCKPAVPNIQ
jgi:LacI family transcriptional regulator